MDMKNAIVNNVLNFFVIFYSILIGSILIGRFFSISPIVIEIVILLSFVLILYLIVYRLIQYYYLKILILQSTFNWTTSIFLFGVGLVYIFVSRQPALLFNLIAYPFRSSKKIYL